MKTSINDVLVYIECLLLNELNPDYIEVSYQNDFIFILIAKEEYKYWSLSERHSAIFNLLKIDIPGILEKYPIILEVHDGEELDDLLKYYEQ